MCSFEVYKKASSALDLPNSCNDNPECKTKQQQAQVEVLTVRTCRKVLVNPDSKFANIDNIIMAR
jgi:hypothetical protein